MATARVIQSGKTQLVELPEHVQAEAELVPHSDRDRTIDDALDAMAALLDAIGGPPEDPPPDELPKILAFFSCTD